jgi:hypothetical protein
MEALTGKVGITSDLKLRVIRGGGETPESLHRAPGGSRLTLTDIMRYGLPQTDQTPEVQAYKRRNLWTIMRGAAKVKLAHALRIPTIHGALYARAIRANGFPMDLGLVSLEVVTDDGVEFIVDAFADATELETMKYHGIGTGPAGTPAAGDSALVAELTTEYVSDNVRATGTTAEGASANIYQTVATHEVDSAVAIVEHGVFDQASAAGGVLFDRSGFAEINLADGDKLETTYDGTFPSGS